MHYGRSRNGGSRLPSRHSGRSPYNSAANASWRAPSPLKLLPGVYNYACTQINLAIQWKTARQGDGAVLDLTEEPRTLCKATMGRAEKNRSVQRRKMAGSPAIFRLCCRSFTSEKWEGRKA